MSLPAPQDADEFFESLAGRRSGALGALALREAVQAEARTVQDAEATLTQDMSPDDSAMIERLRLHLNAAGVWPAGPGLRQPAARWPRLQALLQPSSLPAAALAFSVLVGSLAVLRPWQADDDTQALRGPASLQLSAPEPQQAAEALARRLRDAGAQVTLTPVNAATWALHVEVNDPTQVAPVRRALAAAGLAADGEPPYDITVRRDP